MRLESKDKLLNVRPRNLRAIDAVEWPADFPADFDSAQFCETLQLALREKGLQLTVLDWTPLASATADVVHLLFLAHALESAETLVFVQRTAATEPFWLAHRELLLPGVFGASTAVPTLPWALFGETLTVMPPQWEKCCRPDFMSRLCLTIALPKQHCVICLEEKPTAETPSQLPCVHFICGECQPKTFEPLTSDEYTRLRLQGAAKSGVRKGVTCPVCRDHFKDYCLVPTSDAGPAGSGSSFAFMEYM